MQGLEKLKEKILQKKELEGIPPDFLDKYLEEYKKKNLKSFTILEKKDFNDKSQEFDELKKSIRKKLREVHGVFARDAIGKNKKEKFLEEIKKSNEDERRKITNKILLSHQSTYERIPFYSELYKKVINKKTKKILDLGCGYNPFSYELIANITENPSTEFFVVDINSEDAQFIQKYFDITKIKGHSSVMDLSIEDNITKINNEFPNTDVCFMFKLLDSLESKKRGISQSLFEKINSELYVVSFSIKTISGKNEIKGQRKWFQKILKNMEILDEFTLGPEKYYVLKRLNS